MFEVVFYILVGISVEPNNVAELTHFGPRYESIEECNAAVVKMFNAKDYGEIKRSSSGDTVAWFIDNPNLLSDFTYTCVRVNK